MITVRLRARVTVAPGGAGTASLSTGPKRSSRPRAYAAGSWCSTSARAPARSRVPSSRQARESSQSNSIRRARPSCGNVSRAIPSRVVRVDAADLRLPRRPFRVVANPPYGITSALLRRLLAPGSRLNAADIVVQHAVARRWANGQAPGRRPLDAASIRRTWAYAFLAPPSGPRRASTARCSSCGGPNAPGPFRRRCAARRDTTVSTHRAGRSTRAVHSSARPRRPR